MKKLNKLLFLIPMIAIIFMFSIFLIPKKNVVYAESFQQDFHNSIITKADISFIDSNNITIPCNADLSSALFNISFIDNELGDTSNSRFNITGSNFYNNIPSISLWNCKHLIFNRYNTYYNSNADFIFYTQDGNHNMYPILTIEYITSINIIYDIDNEDYSFIFDTQTYSPTIGNLSYFRLSDYITDIYNTSSYTIPIIFNNNTVDTFTFPYLPIYHFKLDFNFQSRSYNYLTYESGSSDELFNLDKDLAYITIAEKITPFIYSNAYNLGYNLGYDVGTNHGYSQKGLFHNIIDSLSSIFEVRIGGEYGLSIGGICLIGIVILSFFALIKMLR